MNPPTFTALALSLDQGIAEVRLNRPDKSNAMNDAMWQEIRQAFEWIDATPATRVAILSGAGKNFCAGLDLAMLAAIHGACVGGALDLVTCCDMRYGTADAVFSIKEIDLAMVADVGTLQRLPCLIGEGMARELAYTGRKVDAAEAEKLGLLNRIFASNELLTAAVSEIAQTIAAKSPLAIRGIKEVMNFSRDHSVADGLDFVANWNAGLLLSSDLEEAIAAQREKRLPEFSD